MALDLENLKRLALTIRVLSAEGVEKANSGHPGMPMGAADYASLLWANYLRFNPKDPQWQNRDRFVLSAGHGSMLLYSLLHLFGYDLPMSELQSFRQWDSKTPGHPEFGWTPGVETTTGPLGQGIANAVGIALSGKMLAARYGDALINYRVFGIAGDGDMMEGVSSEAASLAGHLKLDNLIFFYDDNEISIGGDTAVCFSESVPTRFEAYGWSVQEVDGHDVAAVEKALNKAIAETGKPKLIVCHSKIGFGSPNKVGTAEVHGAPLGKDELKLTKERLGWTESTDFTVPADVKKYCADLVAAKAKEHSAWVDLHENWSAKNPELGKQFTAQIKRELPATLKDDLAAAFKVGKKDASRNLSAAVIQEIAKRVPFFIGGSADLEPSTKTLIKGSPDIQPGAFGGKNIRFGVREHGMGAVVNGLAYCQSWIPYGSTFLVFSDYMRPTIRLAALSHLQSLFIFTHDSFWVGEDGPTHEPIEHTASLRLIPNLLVFRPADALETALCYYSALSHKHRASTLLFSRQNLAVIDRPADFNADEILRGAYVAYESGRSTISIVATGSELGASIEAAKELQNSGVHARVVSMPCVELFLEQPADVREKILPKESRKVVVEAGTTIGWQRIVGSDALLIGIDHYGASAPGEILAEKFGFTAPALVKRIADWAGKS